MSTIDKITRLTQQNAEFDMELRKRLNVASANSVLSVDERINQIYEYCIEDVIKKQAEEFYADFPLQSIKDILIRDYIRMESFRRKDNFGDFCLSLYQQIECMTNKLCENSALSEITSKMWGCLAYVNGDKDKNYTIADLIFGKSKSVEKSKSTLQAQPANDKMKILVYFLGYEAKMRSGDYEYYKEFTNLLSDIYQCRNMNHRGNTQNQWEKNTYDKIIPLKSLYYFKFLGVLVQYVEYIKKGLGYIPELKKYSDSIEKQKISAPQLNIVGQIDLKDDGRKRFK